MKGAKTMAHLMKSNRGATGGLTRHYERFKDDKGDYIKFGNQEIDINKTNLNYNLADDKNQLEFIKKRTSEVRCLNRKDVNIMATWVVTLPEKIKTPEDQDLFFNESYKFLEEKYGKENVISSYVHIDESTPHMHFSFIPIVYDKKRKDYKVSAKECITRNDLKRFHPELEEHMKKVFGRDIGIMNAKTKEGNKSIDELKKGSAVKELEAIKTDLKSFKSELGMIHQAEDEIKRMGQIKAKEKLFKKGYVEIKKDTFDQLKNMAKNYKKDTELYINNNKILRNNNTILEEKVDRLSEKLAEKNKPKFSLKELKEQTKDKMKIEDLKRDLDIIKSNNKIYKKFIIDEGLGEKFNKSVEKVNQKRKNINNEITR